MLIHLLVDNLERYTEVVNNDPVTHVLIQLLGDNIKSDIKARGK